MNAVNLIQKRIQEIGNRENLSTLTNQGEMVSLSLVMIPRCLSFWPFHLFNQ